MRLEVRLEKLGKRVEEGYGGCEGIRVIKVLPMVNQ
jgi:hypothetical protein